MMRTMRTSQTKTMFFSSSPALSFLVSASLLSLSLSSHERHFLDSEASAVIRTLKYAPSSAQFRHSHPFLCFVYAYAQTPGRRAVRSEERRLGKECLSQV